MNDKELHFHDYVEILLRRRWIAGAFFTILVTLVVFQTFRQKPVYEATATLLFERRGPNVISFKDVSATGNNDAVPKNYYETQYMLIKSRSILEQVAGSLKLKSKKAPLADARKQKIAGMLDLLEKDGPGTSARPAGYSSGSESGGLFSSGEMPWASEGALKKLSKAIKVVPVKNSDLVKVSVEDTDPRQAARIANMVSQEYLRQNIKRNLVVSNEASRWLARAIDEQRKKLKESEDALQQYRQAHNVNVLPETAGDTATESIKAQYAQLVAQYANYSERYTDTHPKMVELKEQIDSLKNKIQGLEDVGLGNKIIEYRVLEQEVQTNKQLYESLFTRAKEIELASTLSLSNISVFDQAIPPQHPVRPRVLFNIIGAIIAGIFGGIACAFFAEYLDVTIKSPEDIKEVLGCQVLGAIPTIEKKSDREKDTITHLHPRSPVAEAYRSLRTAIGKLIVQTGDSVKTILVTSAEMQAGKTMTAANLGIAFSQIGYRVLLVDSDLRKPQLHAIFDVPRYDGLAEYLAHELPLDALTKETGVENLKLITSGKTPQNPAEMINNERMGLFIQETKKLYDLIIFDSPPIMSVTDSVILADKVDATIQVVRSGKAFIPFLINMKEQLFQTKSKMLGVVLNDVKRFHQRYYYYRHYQYYGDVGRRKEKTGVGAV